MANFRAKATPIRRWVREQDKRYWAAFYRWNVLCLNPCFRSWFFESLAVLSRTILIALWLAFIASFFLPAINSLEAAGKKPGTPLTGWQAFMCVQLLIHPGAIIEAPRVIVLAPFIVIANGMAALSPALRLLGRWHAIVSSPLLFIGAMAGLSLPSHATGEVFVGYWLWIWSLAGLSIYWLTLFVRGYWVETVSGKPTPSRSNKQFRLSTLAIAIAILGAAIQLLWSLSSGSWIAITIGLIGVILILAIPDTRDQL